MDFETEALRDATVLLARGRAPKYVEQGGVRVLNQKCVRDGRIDTDLSRRHDPKGKEPDERTLRLGDVLVNSTGVGTLGRVALVNRLDEDTVVDSHITILRPNTELFDPTYFGYAVLALQPRIEALAKGSTGQTELSRVDLGSLEVPRPKKSDQHAIARIIRMLDEKIEINRKMSKTLEEIAATLFRARFVDFVGHDELAESEIGLIPRGWLVTKLSEVCRLEYGKALPKARRRAGGVAVVGSGGIAGWHDESRCEGPGVVLGRKGHAGSVMWIDDNYFPIDTTFNVVPSPEVPLTYLYHALRRIDFDRIVSDSAVPGLNRDAALSREVVMPPVDEMASFAEIVEPITAMRAMLARESKTLTEIRDTLLPKLISGEIRVPEAEEVVEEAV